MGWDRTNNHAHYQYLSILIVMERQWSFDHFIVRFVIKQIATNVQSQSKHHIRRLHWNFTCHWICKICPETYLQIANSKMILNTTIKWHAHTRSIVELPNRWLIFFVFLVFLFLWTLFILRFVISFCFYLQVTIF